MAIIEIKAPENYPLESLRVDLDKVRKALTWWHLMAQNRTAQSEWEEAVDAYQRMVYVIRGPEGVPLNNSLVTFYEEET